MQGSALSPRNWAGYPNQAGRVRFWQGISADAKAALRKAATGAVTAGRWGGSGALGWEQGAKPKPKKGAVVAPESWKVFSEIKR